MFVSSATSNGELDVVLGTSVITGDATVERYMQDKRSYRMVSSAVTTTTSIHDNWQEGATSNTDNPVPGFGTHITGSTIDQENGFDGTATGNPSMFTVNHQAQQFEQVPNTNGVLEAGKPYLLMVRGDRGIDLSDNLSYGETVLRAKGELHTGIQNQNFPALEGLPGELEDAFVMFGNPYQSTVSIIDVFTSSVNINGAYYYVYDPTIGTHGGYVTVNLPDGTNLLGSDANQFLQPGQGAQATLLIPLDASTVSFKEINKVPGNITNTNATGNTLTANNMVTVRLYTTENFNNGGPVHDGVGIIFAEGSHNEVTNADARKPMNFYENLGIDNNGTYLSIEKRAMPQPEEVYQLYSTGYSQAEYTLKLTKDGLQETSLYLDDSFTETSTLLEDGETIYTFSIDANNSLSKATDRFSIRTEARLTVNNNSLLTGIHLFPNPLNEGAFYIHAPKLNGEQVEVNITDMTGRRIYNNMLNCQDNRIAISVNNSLTTGIYLVTLKFAGEENTYRLVKQ